jgi:acylphosphatase
MNIRVHIVVQGIVQGVGFRYFVLHQARKLDLTGWVQNRFTGDVEILAEGDRSRLEIFIDEIKVGPRSAHIKEVRIDWQPYENSYASFEIR